MNTTSECRAGRRFGDSTRGWLAMGLALGLTVFGAGAAPGQVPKLTSSTPANGATGVAVTSSLVFVFDQPMADVAIIPSLGGFIVGNLDVTPSGSAPNLDCEWSGDFRTLTCEPSGEWPASTTLTWKLNPAGALLPITSEGGIPLATTTGTFATGTGGGGGGGEVPKLVVSNPANNATGVSVTADVTFVFDRAMKKNPAIGGVPPFVVGAVAWSGTGVDAAKFSYEWSADGKTLTCSYAGNLPGNTEVSWVLNPANGMVKLQSDEADSQPLATTNGRFTTGQGGGGGEPGCDSDGIPETWGYYSVSKSSSYVQSSAADPVPVAEMPFNFGVYVQGPDAGPAVTAASVTFPGGTRSNLTVLPFGGTLYYMDTPETEAELNASYPAGAYTVRFTQTGQAERAITMNMPASAPPVPKLANFAEAQNINPSQAFTLNWNAFGGAGANDGISLVIIEPLSGVVFQAPDPCVPRELPPTATSILIPAGTLQSNKTYSATLLFGRGFYNSTNTVPEMFGYGSISRQTEFTLSTGGSSVPAVAARFVGYRLLPDGNPEMNLTGTAGRSYTMQRASDPTAPVWNVVGQVTMDAAGNGVFRDAAAGTAGFPLFYRALAP